MKKKILWLILSILMALSLVLASCGEAEEEEEEVIIPPEEEEEIITPPEEEEEVTPPTGGNWWDYHGEPQYGGIITAREAMDIISWDPYRNRNSIQRICLESIAHGDWALDRSIWSYQAVWVPPERHVPCLAKSWEQPDMETVIVHIRQGVHWHDKPPMNGREMDAYDIEWSWHRQSGLGSGFTEHSPWVWAGNYKYMKSITAIDKWTIVFKGTEPTTQLLQSVIEVYDNVIAPREVVEMYGDMNSWEKVCGTGPFIVTDHVADTSISFAKNPNYWGWDERHPENKVPYVDGIKILIIPDSSTAYSALRTGKIDRISFVGWEQAQQLMKTNPELNFHKQIADAPGMCVVTTNPPFNDIRVRKALNMALDRPTIAETYYGGLVEGIAYSWLGPLCGDLYNPFNEWPEDIKEGYIYNPEGAKALLAEAGYPNGFQTNCYISSATDTELFQIVQAYFADIGIEIEVKTVDAPAFFSYVMGTRHADQMYWAGGGATAQDPGPMLDYWTPGHYANAMEATDAHIQDLLHRASTSLDMEETYRLWKEADLYVATQYWLCGLPPTVSYTIWQPWLKGYSAESMTRFEGQRYARWWIDHDLKKSMGY